MHTHSSHLGLPTGSTIDEIFIEGLIQIFFKVVYAEFLPVLVDNNCWTWQDVIGSQHFQIVDISFIIAIIKYTSVTWKKLTTHHHGP